MAGAILLVLAIAFMVFWCHQFVMLMLLSDSDFPGKNDKPVWALAFFLAFFLAPFAFVIWNYANAAMRASEKGLKDETRFHL